MKLIVVGSGGNGQTYFMRFLIRNGFQVNHLWHKDKIKHCRHPKLIENRNITHCIFLYNDPYLAIKSHFRRGYQRFFKTWFGNPHNLSRYALTRFSRLRKLTIEKQKEISGIEYQFNNWIDYKTEYPILFLNLNEVLEKKEEINIFLGKKLNYNSFKYRNRQSIVSNNVKDDPFYKIYQDFYYQQKEKINLYLNSKI